MNKLSLFCFALISIFLSCCVESIINDNVVQTTEYDPQSAGADIEKRITVPAGHYITYTNSHFYLIGDDKIQIFDLSDDKIILLNEIHYDLTPWMTVGDVNPKVYGYTYNGKIAECGGVLDLGNKLVFMIYMGYLKIKLLFSIDYDGSNFCLSDLTSDICDYSTLAGFYYDSDSKKLFTCHKKRHDEYYDFVGNKDYDYFQNEKYIKKSKKGGK